MLPRLLASLVVLVAALGVAASAAAQQALVVDILQLSGPLDPPTLGAVRDLVDEANAEGSTAVVLQVDSDHGIAVTAEDVVEAVADSQVPVVAWVGPGGARAVGAAAYLVSAADVTAAAASATIGPHCPVTAVGGCSVADRALWEEVADAPDLRVDGLEPLLVELDGMEVTTDAGVRTLRLPADEVTVRFHSLGLLERTLHASLSPTFIYLLLVGALLLFLFEAFQPGFGVAGVAGMLLTPLAVYGLVVLPVRWWAVALVVAGMVLLAIDLAIAGLGIPTIAGALAVGIGSAWLFGGQLGLPLWLIIVGTAASTAFFVGVMTVVLRAQAGPPLDEVGEGLIGRAGIVRSAMNPEGHVFVAGALWRARYTGEADGKVRSGTRVRVHGVEDDLLLVDAERDPDTVDTLARSS